MRTCSKCAAQKNDDEFHRGRTECKDCSRAYKARNAASIRLKKQQYYVENKTHILAHQKAYQQRNHETVSATKKRYRKQNKDLIREWHKEHRLANLERYRQSSKEYYEKHRDTIIAKNRKWKELNRERYAELSAQWAIRNADRVRENQRRWREANKDAIDERRRIQRRNRRRTDVDYKIACQLRARLYGALSGRATKLAPTFDLLGCTAQEFRVWIELQFRPGMSWDNWSNGTGNWNVDHIIPIASFDLTDPAQQRSCFHYTNMQPLWWEENQEKSDHLDWRREDAA